MAGLVATLIAVTAGATAWFFSANSGHTAAPGEGFQLIPGYWISELPNYVMVGLTATTSGTSDKVLRGDVVGPGGTTFSLSR